MVGNGLMGGVQGVLKDKFSDLQNETGAFQEYMTEQEKELKRAEALLDSSQNLSPLIVFGETPDEFFNRTVHSGNIGVLGLDAISNYVDTALTLPKLSESIGDYL